LIEVGNHLCNRAGVILGDGHVEQLISVAEACSQIIDKHNDLLQRRPFLSKRLRSIRFIPDIGLFQLALNFGQALRLAVIVKDTPSTQ
jgi:hypothetical protein